jgi:ubiquinone/menaquinone biosynthesis C-methylase UbiE
MSISYAEESDFAEKLSVIDDMSFWLEHCLGQSRIENALEIGGSGGVLSGLFAGKFGKTICTDIVDWDLTYNGEGMKLLSEKFSRNGYVLAADRLKYIPADAQNLFFRDDWFDVVFSLNAFEHIPSPADALREAIRVTRPGGMLYLRFDPVWTADSGSHFLHYIKEPWEHLLKDDDAIAQVMVSNGASPVEVTSYKLDMNRLPVSYYQNVLPAIIDELGCRVEYSTSWSGVTDDAFMQHPSLTMAAKKLGLKPEDLLVRGFQFVISKG